MSRKTAEACFTKSSWSGFSKVCRLDLEFSPIVLYLLVKCREISEMERDLLAEKVAFMLWRGIEGSQSLKRH